MQNGRSQDVVYSFYQLFPSLTSHNFKDFSSRLNVLTMPRSSNEAMLVQVTSTYLHHDLMKRDVLNALQHYRGLSLKHSHFIFNDGTDKELLCLDGTIPVSFKGNTYNIPIAIWILDNHPYSPPMCYVKPTQTMHIKVSRHVDQNGKVYLPYLHEWKHGSSDILGLIQVMIIVFGELPPVYSRTAAQQTQPNVGSSAYSPYSGAYMPSANTATATPQHPSYPYPVSNPAPAPGYPQSSSYQPPYPSSTQSNFSSGYQPYPPYPGNTGYPVATSASYSTSSTTGYPPYPSTTSMAPTSARNKDIHSEKEERLLQLSAVENKLRQRLDETFSQMQAEIDVLKKTRTDLTNGKGRLNEIVQKLQTEHDQLDHNIRILRDKDAELTDVLEKMDSQDELDIDDAVTTTAPLYKQLLQLYAEENATQDTIYYLGEGLRRGIIDLDVFLKHVRELSRKQFMLRALMQKCREKAGLPY